MIDSRAKPRPRIIGIAGGSGSGKTTLARQVRDALGAEIGKVACAILYQDSYYIDQSARFDHDGGSVNFDHPSAIDFALMAAHLAALKRGEPIDVPIYDFATHTRRPETTRFEPLPTVILDGTMILSQPAVRALLDLAVFLQVPEATRFERRLRRDTTERGRTPDGVRAQFTAQVKPMHDQFVEPSSAVADLVVGNDDALERTLERLSTMGLTSL